jgi:flagellar basal body L-ring protein FlgH
LIIKSALGNLLRIVLILSAVLMTTSCASIGQKWKALIGGGETPAPTTRNLESQGPSFTSQPNMMVGKDRKYKRVTKDNFSDDQGLEDSSGSLWRREGQGSYLFSQNNLRVLGDIVNVNVEGKTSENLDTKLGIIKQALARLEAPPMRSGPVNGNGNGNGNGNALRTPANAGGVTNGNGNQKNLNAQAPPVAAIENAEGASPGAGGVAGQKDKMKFEPVPCRIVEKNPDGSYRVKGQQTVYVGKHEYRLVVTGILHADDVSDGSISSGKLLDSKFDLLASNKETHNEPMH